MRQLRPSHRFRAKIVAILFSASKSRKRHNKTSSNKTPSVHLLRQQVASVFLNKPLRNRKKRKRNTCSHFQHRQGTCSLQNLLRSHNQACFSAILYLKSQKRMPASRSLSRSLIKATLLPMPQTHSLTSSLHSTSLSQPKQASQRSSSQSPLRQANQKPAQSFSLKIE